MKLVTKLSLSTLALLCALPAAAQAEQTPNFDFAEISYVNIDAADESLKGVSLELDKSFNENWFMTIDVTTGSETFEETYYGTRVTGELEIGYSVANIGYRFATSEAVNLYMEAGLASIAMDMRVSGGGYSERIDESESGWNVGLGVRSALSENFQLDLRARHIDIDDTTDRELSVEGRYFVNEKFSVSANYSSFKDDLSFWGLGLAYHF